MQAVVVDAVAGPPHLTQLPVPALGARQVLVKVKASGVNPLDVKIQFGKAPHAQQALPAVLGLDLAGEVEAVGPGVTAFRRGDEVYGMTGGVGGVQGTLAEYAVVDVDLIAPKPARLSMREAASLPLVALTAWEGIVDQAHVHSGQRVLVQGGAGGVGQIVVQLVQAFGAQAFAVDGAAKREFLEQLGATPIDRATSVEDYVAKYADGRGFDIVYDTVGALEPSFKAVRRFGHVVSCLGWGTHSLAALSFRAANYSGVFALHPLLSGEGRAHHGEILRQVATLVDAGKVSPRVDPRRFTLATVADAYRALEAGGSAGKLVVDVGE